MMLNPKVSVIIPAYNVGEYIEKCVRSVINQTYHNIEIIVVNDGSKDNTLSIINLLAQEEPRLIIIDKKNGGVSAARNDAMRNATGEYIVFVDGDDYLAEDFVEYMLSTTLKNGADFCFSLNCFLYDGESQVNKIEETLLTAEEATGLLLSPRVSVGCWNKIFKKSVLDKYDILFMEDLFYGEGLYFITAFSQRASKTICSNKKVYYYRRNNDTSATTKFNINAIRNGLMALERIDRDMTLHSEYVDRMLSNHKSSYHLMSVVKLRKSGKYKEYPNDYKLSLNYVRQNLKKSLTCKESSLMEKASKMICAISPALIGYMANLRSEYTSAKSVK